jgi:hypothetical protein
MLHEKLTREKLQAESKNSRAERDLGASGAQREVMDCVPMISTRSFW